MWWATRLKISCGTGQGWQVVERRAIDRASSAVGAGSSVSFRRAFPTLTFPPYLGSHVQSLDFTVSDSSQFSIKVGGEVVGQEVRSGQARVLVKGLLCDLKAHGGVRNSLQELVEGKSEVCRGTLSPALFYLRMNHVFTLN